MKLSLVTPFNETLVECKTFIKEAIFKMRYHLREIKCLVHKADCIMIPMSAAHTSLVESTHQDWGVWCLNKMQWDCDVGCVSSKTWVCERANVGVLDLGSVLPSNLNLPLSKRGWIRSRNLADIFSSCSTMAEKAASRSGTPKARFARYSSVPQNPASAS